MRTRALLVLAVALLAGCAGSAGEPPAEEPDIVGVATRVQAVGPDGDPPGTVLVEERPGTDAGGRKISFTVDDATVVLRATADGHVPSAVDEISEGSTVSAWTTGSVAESYPEQATAGTIVLEETP